MLETIQKILIIDDEVSLLKSLIAFFEDEGFIVWGAESGETGLEILQNERMDAVIVDMRLPGIDGNETILRAHSQQPSLIFLIYTGSTDYQLPASLLALGITQDMVFSKPQPDLAVLTHAVRGYCRFPSEPDSP